MQGIITLNRMFGQLRETVSRFMNQNPVRNRNVEFGWRRVLRPNSLPEPLLTWDRIQWQLHRQLPEEHPEVAAVREDHLSILMVVQVDGEDFPGIMDDPMDHQAEDSLVEVRLEDQVVLPTLGFRWSLLSSSNGHSFELDWGVDARRNLKRPLERKRTYVH